MYIATSRSTRSRPPDEIAAHIWTHGTESSSINYIRQSRNPEYRQVKAESRNHILNFFGSRDFPGGLSILTMPGLEWSFERQLLHRREGPHYKDRVPARTDISCIEWDEAIFRCALAAMPGAHDSLVQISSPGFASDTYSSRLINRYHRCRFDDLAEWYALDGWESFDAAWLDFSGPISTVRMRALTRLWSTSIRRRLIITALNCRWDADASEQIDKAGGVTQWFLRNLPNAKLFFDDRYQTGVPMLQVGVDRTELWKPVLTYSWQIDSE